MREPAKKGEVTFTGMTPDQYESYVGVSEYLISEGNTTPGEAAEGLTRCYLCKRRSNERTVLRIGPEKQITKTHHVRLFDGCGRRGSNRR